MNSDQIDAPLKMNSNKIDASYAKSKADILHQFKVDFFAMSRLSTFPWTVVDKELQHEKSSTFILDVLKETCLHPLCHKHPPSVKYRRVFLTELLRRYEATQLEPLDELYEALGNVLGTPENTECYKSYLLPGENAVSLLESVAVISEGTTGLVTWEAALYLTEWALENPHSFTGRTVLELGSGVGLAGIAVCRSCMPSRYVFSDRHPRVLQMLRANVQLNGLTQDGSPRVCVEELDWGSVTDEQLRELRPNTVIAADVVYDPDIIGCLVELLSAIMRCSSQEGSPEVLISSTIRNPDTYNFFKSQLESAGIRHDVITGAANHMFPYSRAAVIEMIKLHL